MKLVVKKSGDLTESEIAQWIALQEADPDVAPAFFRPEYAIAVGQLRGNVEVVLAMDGADLVGVLPFEREGRNTGRPVASRLSDSHGLIARRGLSLSPVDLVRAGGLVSWRFDHLVTSQSAFRPYHYWVDRAPFMDLSRGYEAYVSERHAAGTSLIRQAERKLRKLTREVGPVRFEYHTSGESEFEKLLEWKSLQLARWNLFDVFKVDWVVALLQEFRRMRSPAFAGVVSALYAGQQLVAVHFGLKSHRNFCAWIPTMNPEFSRYSPGLILHLELAKCAEEKEYDRIDLGRGLNPLKSSLASGAVELAIGSVDTRPVVARMAKFSDRAIRSLPTSRLRHFPPAVAALRLMRGAQNRLARD